MYYTDGSVYEGEWYDDMRNGEGMLRLGKGSFTLLLVKRYSTTNIASTR